ncbi:MAG: NAD-dependent epimerase/dehydratase family protein [Polyangiaceae bacterium]|nr:NAD-dependent epimerase/dehydratase family protein [Polyangiaceae bacterium]
MQTVAVTGITSGVGLRFAEMAVERGITVRALVRDPARADAKRLASMGITLERGDLDDRRALEAISRGASSFFHFAAHVGDRGEASEFVRVNVGGTRNALDAAKAGGVRRFVHLSSTAVYGRPDRGRVDESWPTRHTTVPYDDTKVDAERLAFARGAELGLEVTAVRPPIIYGPYDRNFMPRAVDSLRHHRFLLVGGGRAPLNVVWVDHVVDVALLASERPEARGEAFNVMDEVDARPPSVREVGTTIAEAVGAPPPRLSLPYSVAMGAAHVVERVTKLRDPNAVPPISPFVVKILTRDVIYDASKAQRLLGWKPKVRALDGLAREARSFAERERRA